MGVHVAVTAILSGASADCPTSGVPGRAYFATDTGAITYDNGSSWVSLGGSSSGATDAADLTYTPTTVANWTGAADPGDADAAFDQLASRIQALEANIYGTPKGSLSRSYTFDSTVESWTTDGGTLSASGGYLQIVEATSTSRTVLEPSGSANVADGEVVFQLLANSGTDHGVVFRATDAANHYLLALRMVGNSGNVELFKRVSSTYTSLGSMGFKAGNAGTSSEFRVMVRFYGSRIEAFINGGHAGFWSDSTYTTGRVGIRVQAGTLKANTVRVYTLSSDPVSI